MERHVPVIAIIDDDKSVRSAIKSLVMSRGFVALTFASAEEFLNSSCVTKATCVVADVQLPGLSGIDLQELLAARGCPTPVIFMTAFPKEKDTARALNKGAVAFLTKPFDGNVLVKSIEAALRCR